MSDLTLEQVKDAARRAAQDGNLASARRLLAMARQMEGQTAAPVPTESVVAETAGVPDGRVVRREDGSLAFVSPGASTSDPDVIQRLMRGMSYADASRPTYYEAAVDDAPVAARAATALQGVPFVGEYADEAVGGMFGATARDAMRFSQEAMAETRPGQTFGLQVGAGLASAVPAVIAAGPGIAAAAPTSPLGRIGMGMGLGAVLGGSEGAVSGFGAGNAGGRVGSAMERGAAGAVAGGLIGGALPAFASGLSRAYGAVMDRFTGGQRVLPGMSREASDAVIQMAQADDLAGEGLQGIMRAGPQGMLADTGPAMQSLLDRAVNLSPSGANIAGRAVTRRAEDAAQDLATTFDDALGGAEGQRALFERIRQATQPGINEAYTRAYATPIDYSSDAGRKIEGILRRIPSRIARSAIERATERMRYDGAPRAQIMAEISDEGGVTFRQMPNVMQLDYIKRALDGIARDGTDPITGKLTDDAAFASRIARDLRRSVADAVEPYGEALAEASDAFALQNARELGQRLLTPNTTREAVRNWVEEATPIERQSLIASLRSDIDERMANARRAAGVPEGVAEARKIFGEMSSPAAREKIKAVLGEDDASKVLGALDRAEAALELRTSVAANSRTAARTIGDAQLRDAINSRPSEIAREVASGGLVTGTRRGMEVLAGNTAADRALRDDAVYGEIARALTEPRGQAAIDLARQAQGIMSYVPRADAMAGRVGQIGAASGGLLAYLLAMQGHRRSAGTAGPR